MSIIIALLIILIVSLSVSILLNTETEAVLPPVLLSSISILFFFYCADLLLMGMILVLGIYIVVSAAACKKLYRSYKHKTAVQPLRLMFSPGICVFIVLCIFALIYCRNSVTFLWDELRLWAPVPKAMHYTNSLQLKEDSLIFAAMRHYPPGMHLLVYFFTFFGRGFHESHIFIVYAIFVYSLFLPVLKNMKWKHYPLFVPFIVFLIILPCILTNKSRDFCYFYQSLYIEPPLGFLIGFSCWLSLHQPLSSRIRMWQFCSALFALTLFKESGVLFSCILALAVFLMEVLQKQIPFKKCLYKSIFPFFSVAVPFLVWELVCRFYQVYNHLSISTSFSILTAVKQLINYYLSVPIIVIPIFDLWEIKLDLWIVIAVSLLFITLIIWYGRKIPLKSWGVLAVFLCITVFIFLTGMYGIFGDTFECAQRYGATLSICLICLLLMLGLELLLAKFPQEIRFSAFLQKSFSILLAGLSVILCIFFLRYWNQTSLSPKEIAPITAVSQNLLSLLPKTEVKEKPARIYLLTASHYLDSSMLHFRIYFDLIGTPANICNLFDNALSYAYIDPPDLTDSAAIYTLAQQWSIYLMEQNFDYIYVVTADTLTGKVFDALPGSSTPVQNHLYQVVAGENLVQLKDITPQ